MNIVGNFKRPKFAIYQIAMKMKIKFPFFVGFFLSRFEMSSIKNYLRIETYDGSGQACHPSITMFNGTKYMVCTPYPCSNEFYENPSLYRYDDEKKIYIPSNLFPIESPKFLGKEFFSDPCIFTKDEKICLIYRKCTRKKPFNDFGTVEEWYYCDSLDGINWSPVEKIAEGGFDQLICPGISDNSSVLFFVKHDISTNKFSLMQVPFSRNIDFDDSYECFIEGLAEDEFVWHIDISTKNEIIKGLFMIKSKNARPYLAIFSFNYDKNVWQKERNIEYTDEEKGFIRFFYKSAFDVENKKLLCSVWTINNHFLLYEKYL